jgi:hypothetical protein
MIVFGHLADVTAARAFGNRTDSVGNTLSLKFAVSG